MKGTSAPNDNVVASASAVYQEVAVPLDRLLARERSLGADGLDLLKLPRGNLRVTITLPADSKVGTYEVKISSLVGQPLVLENGKLTVDGTGNKLLKVSMNTSRLVEGEYSLSLRQGMLAWITVPLRIK